MRSLLVYLAVVFLFAQVMMFFGGGLAHVLNSYECKGEWPKIRAEILTPGFRAGCVAFKWLGEPL